jgi:hypothetical protein
MAERRRNTVKSWIILGALAALLAGCGGAASKIESAMILPGDFPSDMQPGPMQTKAGGLMFFNLPSADVVRYQEIFRGSELIGNIAVFVYPAAATRNTIYQTFVDGLGTDGHAVRNIGDQAAAQDSGDGLADLTFVRCTALVFVRLETTQQTVDYAQRLDQRLAPIVC